MSTLSFKSAATFTHFLGAATPGVDAFPYPDDLVGLYYFGGDQDRSIINHGSGPDLTVTGTPVYNDFYVSLASGSYFDTGILDQNNMTEVLIMKPIPTNGMGAYQDVAATPTTNSDGHFIVVTGTTARLGEGRGSGTWSQWGLTISSYITDRPTEFFMLAGTVDQTAGQRRVFWGADGVLQQSSNASTAMVAASPARSVKIGGYSATLASQPLQAVGAMLYHRPLTQAMLAPALAVWSAYCSGKVNNGMDLPA